MADQNASKQQQKRADPKGTAKAAPTAGAGTSAAAAAGASATAAAAAGPSTAAAAAGGSGCATQRAAAAAAASQANQLAALPTQQSAHVPLQQHIQATAQVQALNVPTSGGATTFSESDEDSEDEDGDGAAANGSNGTVHVQASPATAAVAAPFPTPNAFPNPPSFFPPALPPQPTYQPPSSPADPAWVAFMTQSTAPCDPALSIAPAQHLPQPNAPFSIVWKSGSSCFGGGVADTQEPYPLDPQVQQMFDLHVSQTQKMLHQRCVSKNEMQAAILQLCPQSLPEAEVLRLIFHAIEQVKFPGQNELQHKTVDAIEHLICLWPHTKADIELHLNALKREPVSEWRSVMYMRDVVTQLHIQSQWRLWHQDQQREFQQKMYQQQQQYQLQQQQLQQQYQPQQPQQQLQLLPQAQLQPQHLTPQAVPSGLSSPNLLVAAAPETLPQPQPKKKKLSQTVQELGQMVSSCAGVLKHMHGTSQARPAAPGQPAALVAGDGGGVGGGGGNGGGGGSGGAERADVAVVRKDGGGSSSQASCQDTDCAEEQEYLVAEFPGQLIQILGRGGGSFPLGGKAVLLVYGATPSFCRSIAVRQDSNNALLLRGPVMGGGQLASGACEVTFTSSGKVVDLGMTMDNVTPAQWIWKADNATTAARLHRILLLKTAGG